MVSRVNIIKQEIIIEESLKKKLELICEFSNTNMQIINGSIRKIDNYFNKISNDDKHDLVCEIIIELGNMSYWENKSLDEKYKMISVFEKQLDDLKEIVPNFYVANTTCHFDEHSPHLHIIGVPVKENCKTGLSKQIGKTSIFTKESLVIIQDKMREKSLNLEKFLIYLIKKKLINL